MWWSWARVGSAGYPDGQPQSPDRSRRYVSTAVPAPTIVAAASALNDPAFEPESRVTAALPTVRAAAEAMG
jgi:hypothetical protein